MAALRAHIDVKPIGDADGNNGAGPNTGSSSRDNNIFQDESRVLNTVYKDVNYWNDRFKEERTYDWLLSFDQVKDILVPHIPSTSSRILVVGCGNSTFSAGLYDYGYTNIVNIDFSEIVIDAMEAENKELRPLMEWKCMDMTDLSDFADGSFDVVIDKAAMDAIMVDEGDVWNPKSEVVELADKMCLGISRVLKNTGIHLQISFAQPHFRTKYLFGCRQSDGQIDPFKAEAGYCERYAWNLSSETIECGGCLPYFLYIMRR
jgi:SAM-dependent methyltransferase